jgi:hypothetical protein
MRKKLLLSCFIAVLAIAMSSVGGASATDAPKLDPGLFGLTVMNSLAAPVDDPLAPSGFYQVKPQEFDPGRTGLVQAAWLDGTGCPTQATIAEPNADFTGIGGYASYADAGCPTGDPKDQHFEGLLLAKTGPSENFAAATAELTQVKGVVLTELGWDLRKSGGSTSSPLGSHCGAGAPRWDIQTTTHFYFIGCNSPPGAVEAFSTGWLRERWGGSPGSLVGFCVDCTAPFSLEPVTGAVVRLQIVFDEGQDTGLPDNFGAAFLDNIDVNGALVGHGATDASSR